MKRMISALAVVLILSLNVQAQTAAEAIAEKTCSCLSKLDTTLTSSQYQAEMGICMIREAMPYEKELKKKEHIDLSNMNKETGQQLGRLIGMKMMSACPDQMKKLVAAVMKDGEEKTTKKAPAAEEEPVKVQELKSRDLGKISGTVTDMSPGQFITITVRDADGKDHKMLWLTYFSGQNLFKDGIAGVKGKKVTMTYDENDYYNPAIKDYMKYKVILSAEMAK